MNDWDVWELIYGLSENDIATITDWTGLSKRTVTRVVEAAWNVRNGKPKRIVSARQAERLVQTFRDATQSEDMRTVDGTHSLPPNGWQS